MDELTAGMKRQGRGKLAMGLRRKGSVPVSEASGSRWEGKIRLEEEPRMPIKSNSLPGLQLEDAHGMPLSKEKLRMSATCKDSMRITVQLKPVSIGAEVVVESDHPPSLSFNQYFLTTIQRKQQSAEKNLRPLKAVHKTASLNTSSLSLTQDMERKEPAFPLKREKLATPLRLQLSKMKRASKPLAVGVALPSPHVQASDDHYRAKSAVSLYRIRKSGQKPQTRINYREPSVFEKPLKGQILVNKLISPKTESHAKAKKGLYNVTYVQCQPYRIPIDFGLFRNVKKLFGTRLRAMFDIS